MKNFEVDLATGPTIEQVDIEIIAHALANTCRYTGHSNRFYSVAEHSVYVSYMSGVKMFSIYFLLHDCHEAYYHDISKPLKNLMKNISPDFYAHYEKLCDQADKTIIETLGLNHNKFLELHDVIKEADIYLLNMEQQYLFYNHEVGFPDDHPLKHVPFGLDPVQAKRLFLETYHNLI